MTSGDKKINRGVSIEDLLLSFDYEPDTGKLFWKKEKPRSLFNTEKGYKVYHKQFAGREAASPHAKPGQSNPYYTVRIKNRLFLVHRVIWAIINGVWPKNEIDHIDGNPSNNRIENLRDVTSSVNKKNLTKRSNNTSGVTGVCWDKHEGKWLVRVSNKWIGRFKLLDDAIKARQQALEGLEYTERHGN